MQPVPFQADFHPLLIIHMAASSCTHVGASIARAYCPPPTFGATLRQVVSRNWYAPEAVLRGFLAR